MNKTIFAVILLMLSAILSDAATPLFLQAITSALATIPFSGGPMTTGLVGAKLGIGTKLLYYLGYFGRRKPASAKRSAPKRTAPKKVSPKERLQPLPLPYMMSGGNPKMPGRSQAASNFQPQFGVDPAQLFQALTAQGVDPSVAVEAINYAGGMNSGPNPGFPNPAMSGFNPNSGFGGGFGGSFPPNAAFPPNAVPAQQFSRPGGSFQPASSNPPPLEPEEPEPDTEGEGEGADDAESFFTFLQDMDENTCISRLICDIGNDPSFLGDFSENIHSMVGTLNVPPTSRAFQYIEIMEKGRQEGQCKEKFPECSDMSYEVVKNVAPSVSLPQNVDNDAISNL